MQGENGAQEMVVSAAVGGPVAPEPISQFLPLHSWYMHCHPLVSGGHGFWASLNLLICPLGLPWGRGRGHSQAGSLCLVAMHGAWRVEEKTQSLTPSDFTVWPPFPYLKA